jgi:hypothetical protein
MIGVEDNDNKRGREAEAEEGRKLKKAGSSQRALARLYTRMSITWLSYWYRTGITGVLARREASKHRALTGFRCNLVHISACVS